MAKPNNTHYNFMNGVDKPQDWQKDLPSTELELDEVNFNLFFEMMFERQEIWYRRFILKQKAPWSTNQHLTNNKFTNVYRELDRASQWLIKNVFLDETLSDIDLVWKIICFRFFNQPDTFDMKQKVRIDLPRWGNWDVDRMYEQTIAVRESGRNPWHTAYMMNLAFLKKTHEPKRGLWKDYAYVCFLLKSIHAKIPKLLNTMKSSTTPEDVISLLETFPAVSTFQSHEFFIDFCYIKKYTNRCFFKYTEMDYTNVGPGASLGLRLIFPSTPPKDQKAMLIELFHVAAETLSEIGESNNSPFKYIQWNKTTQKYDIVKTETITLHTIEMWLCEFSKLWKMMLGKGKQRSKFKAASYQTKLY